MSERERVDEWMDFEGWDPRACGWGGLARGLEFLVLVPTVSVFHVDSRPLHIVDNVLRGEGAVAPVNDDAALRGVLDRIADESARRARPRQVEVQGVLAGDAVLAAALDSRVLHLRLAAAVRDDVQPVALAVEVVPRDGDAPREVDHLGLDLLGWEARAGLNDGFVQIHDIAGHAREREDVGSRVRAEPRIGGRGGEDDPVADAPSGRAGVVIERQLPVVGVGGAGEKHPRLGELAAVHVEVGSRAVASERALAERVMGSPIVADVDARAIRRG